ncbi:hypothetical protein LTS18_000244, partial [Coniosporium uncinatum]
MLFALGSNGAGQLGLGHDEDVAQPEQTCIPPSFLHAPLKAIAAGGNHTSFLTTSGQLWIEGSSSDIIRNACGRQEDLGYINLCASTWNAVICATSTGKVWSYGTECTKGELGLGGNIGNESVGIHETDEDGAFMKGFPPSGTAIVDLAASMGHTVAVLSNGDVYGWGNGRKGQL